MLLLFVRRRAAEVAASTKPGRVTVSIVNPGSAISDVNRETTGLERAFVKLLELTVFRRAGVGSRTLVSAAAGGAGAHARAVSE